MKEATRDLLRDVGLLILRVGAGGLMLVHGVPKLERLMGGGGFADPIGIGPTPSLALAVFAEVGCSIALALGLLTRLATLPLITTMLVAVLVVHADDPWSKKELGLLYLVPYLTLLLAGPGRFAVDAKLKGRLGALR